VDKLQEQMQHQQNEMESCELKFPTHPSIAGAGGEKE
jgi:hypothetical protein